MSWTNYHSHSHYCDGKFPPEAHLQKAIDEGLLAFGFSSHAPVSFETSWCMKTVRLPEYVAEVRALREKYRDQIEVYAGLEVDFVPGIAGPRHPLIAGAGLDYTIGSVHFVDSFPDGRHWEIDGPHTLFLEGLQAIFSGDAEAAVSRYFALTRQMVEEDCPDVVGHLDKIKMQNEGGELFSESAPWYRQAVRQTLEVIRAAGVIVEVNTRGQYKKKTPDSYPGPWILQEMYRMGIPVCLNSDSHHPDEIQSGFPSAAEMLQAIGYQELWVLLQGEWIPRPFDTDGIKA